MRIVVIVLAFSLLLTGCFGFVRDAFDTRKNPGPCPVAGALYDVARIVVFSDDQETFDNVRFTGDIRAVRLFCRYADADPMRVEVEIDFALGRGPAAAEEEKYDYKYFVAVTRRNSKVLNKKEFDLEMYFVDGDIVENTQLIAPLVIPRADETISGANFEVVVGFVLTDKQLEFNRAGRRFRLNVGQ